MQIYKITGEDGYQNETRELYVRAMTEQAAQRTAMRRGVVKGVSEACRPGDVPGGVPIIPADTKSRRESLPALETHPVRTIALGVLLGLVAFTVLMWAFAFVLGVIGITLFGGD
ncbi:MAG: hypothetical protein AAGH64_00650 [Planctomycetota bacterium]